MKKIILLNLLCSLIVFPSCNNDMVEYQKGDISIHIVEGRNWLHDYPLFLGINKKNPPQIAVWMEDSGGRYLSTIYASKKIATQGWVGAKGNRRKEALPHWGHARGICYEDGIYSPTKDQPLVDGMTGATPHGGFDLKLMEKSGMKNFSIKVEVNHSTDFNDTYTKNATEGTPFYSGGKDGSGQPALVYKADIDLTSGQTVFTARLIGHSSPDGSDGKIYTDMDGMTSALEIIKAINITIK